MTNFRLGLLLVFFSAAAAVGSAAITPRTAANSSFTPGEQSQGYVNGRVLVKLRSDVTGAEARSQDAENHAGITSRRSFRRLTGQHVLEFDQTKPVTAVIKELRATGLYEFVEADRILHARVIPNDPSFGQQWSLNNTGQTGGTPGADIGATTAWNLQSDASNVIVAIIDSGIRLTHTDLKDNLWVNPTPGTSGFAGDLNGINAINGTGNPSDNNGHGSHVSGIIGATGNNANSISGVAWKAKLMALKFLGSDGSGTTSDSIACIDYAIAHGASVINASYGTTVYSASEFAAIQRARDAGIIFVAAAGNDSLSTDNGADYPAAYSLDNIVTVAATTKTDALASYSDFGSGSVDLAAPGDQILSTFNTSDTATQVESGTSMAAPHVTGALALLKAHFPNDTYRQLINRLLRSTTKLAGLSGKVQSGGRLNLAQALASTDSRPLNDDFSTRAQLASANVLVRSSNVGATREPDEPSHAGVTGGASLWWTWTASSSSVVTFDTAGSSYDTALAVYTGSTLESLQLVGANDDAAPGTTTSSVTFSVVAGTTYQIAIDGKVGASGLTVLRIAARPDNDNLASAQAVSGTSVLVSATNLYATSEPGEPNPAGAGAGHSVWYQWVAPATAGYTLAAYSTAVDTVAGVYTGSSVSNLTLVAANDDSAGHNSDALVTFNATAGVTYYFLVDNNATDGTSGGAFTLTLTDSLWQLPAADQITSTPAVGSDGTIYVGSLDGFFYAINADGTSKWESTANNRSTGIVVDLSTPALGSDGTIYVGSTDDYLYALNPTTGSRKWRFLTTTPLYSSPAIAADGTIYVRDDTNLYALTGGTSSVVRKWSATLSGAGTYGSPSIAADGTIYVGTGGGNFYAFNPDGTTKWTFTADNDIYATPAIDGGGTVYFATLSGTVYALNPNGTKKWSWSIGSGITSSPAIGADGTLYFGAYDHKLHALRSNGTDVWSYTLGDEVRASSPAIAADGTIYLGCYDSQVYAVSSNGILQRTFATAGLIRSSPVIANGRLYFASTDAKLYAYALGQDVAATVWPMFHQNATHNARAVAPPSVTLQPVTPAAAGSSVTLTASASGTPTPTYQWQYDGSNVSGATSSSLTLANLQPANAGLYTAVVTSGTSITSDPAIVGVLTSSEVIGAGTVLQPTRIVHPNGNIFDQVLLTGAAETLTALPGQVTRTSYIDLNDDIVQVEFSGAGTLSLVLDNPSGPAAPVNYNQPGVTYMKGHAGIVITGADDTTNVSVFTVGRATAFDPTGGFNILLPVSGTNNPANNGSPLFQGHATTAYDGVADIAFIAIASPNGKFGGVRTANANYFAVKSLTGVYAPGVQFTGPVFVGDISASDAAIPVLMIGSSPDTRITGGDLFQANGQPVKVSGLTQLKFTAGQDSNGNVLSAKASRGVLQQNGSDVTAQVVVNPSP